MCGFLGLEEEEEEGFDEDLTVGIVAGVPVSFGSSFLSSSSSARRRKFLALLLMVVIGDFAVFERRREWESDEGEFGINWEQKLPIRYLLLLFTTSYPSLI